MDKNLLTAILVCFAISITESQIYGIGYEVCPDINPSGLNDIKTIMQVVGKEIVKESYTNEICILNKDFLSSPVAVKNQCLKSTEVTLDYAMLFATWSLCDDEATKQIIMIFRDVIRTLIPTLCDDDAKILISYLYEEDGIKCFNTKEKAISKCLEGNEDLTINTIFDLCKYMDHRMSCYVNEMVKCENSKSGNIIKSVYDHVRRSTKCPQIDLSRTILIAESRINGIKKGSLEELCLKNNPSQSNRIWTIMQVVGKEIVNKGRDTLRELQNINIVSDKSSVAFKNQCMKSAELKDSFEIFFNTYKVCMDEITKQTVEIFQNAIKTLISTLCDDGAKILISYLYEEDGIKCFNTKEKAISKCLEGNEDLTINTIFDLCKYMDHSMSCYVNEMVKCENSKSGNIIKSVYDNVRRSTMCSQIDSSGSNIIAGTATPTTFTSTSTTSTVRPQTNSDKNHTSGSNIIAGTATPTTFTSTSTTSTVRPQTNSDKNHTSGSNIIAGTASFLIVIMFFINIFII